MFWVQEFVNSFSGIREAYFLYKFRRGCCFVIKYYLSKHVNNNQVMRQIGTNYYSAFIYAYIYGATLDNEP